MPRIEIRETDLKRKLFLKYSVVFLSALIALWPRTAVADPVRDLPEQILIKTILDNGLTVIIEEEHANPLVSVRVTVMTGLSSEGEYAGSGITHFLEHMIFKGTPKRKPGQIEEEVKSYGGVMNASTGFDSTGYYITVPKEHAGEALELVEDVVFNPSLDAGELELEREVILKEIRLNRDDPARRVMKGLWETAYIAHPYKLPIIGYEELFSELKREDLVKYHAARYVSNNIILTVVGDIDAEDTLARVKELFGRHKRKMYPDVAVPLEPGQNSPRRLTEFSEINLGYIAMGYHTVNLTDNDLYAMDVLGIILGNWDDSRLNKKLVKEDELLYAVSSFNYTPKYPGLFVVYGIGDYKKLEKAKDAILEEIDKVLKGGATEGELNAAKAMVISGYINSLETTAGLASVISEGEFLAGDANFFKDYVANVKKVNNQALLKAANKYLNKNNLTISYLYPEYAKEPRVSGQDLSLHESAKMSRLSNGIRLILKKEARLPKISIVCAFLGGVRAETEKNNGVSSLTAAVMLKGTKTRKESQIKPFLESQGGSISNFSGKNTFGVSVDSLSENTKDALDVLEDVIMNPVFPEEEIRKEKEKFFAAIKQEDDDIYATGFLKLRKELFKGYPYALRTLGEPASLEKLTQNDLKDFHGKLCRAPNMVISVVGDFDAAKMRGEIERRFKNLSQSPVSLETPEVPPFLGENKITCDMKREQSLVVVGFRGTAIDNPDKYRLEVLGSVMSGENGRLYEAIRNKLGLSYALGTFSSPGIDTGYIASYAGTDRTHLDEVCDALLDELKKVKKGSIEEKEIDLAKRDLIGKHQIALESYKYLAYQMAIDEICGAGFDAYEKYPERVSSITRRDIIETAKRYVDLKNLSIVTVIGESND